MACSYYEWRGGTLFGDFWCIKKDCRVDSDTYYRYCRDYSYGDCPIYRQGNSSGCFITTVVCDILGNDDNSLVLNNLRSFRDNVLQQDSKYDDILKDYDNIGPVLADSIMNDKDKVEMAFGLYNNVIIPISNLIGAKNYDKACEMYYVMILSLINYYGLKHEYNMARDMDYGYCEFDSKVAGHGKRRIRLDNMIKKLI